MKSGLKVMMVSEGNDFGQTCAGVLRSYGCDVKMVPKNGAEILHKTETEKPDVVVMDAFYDSNRCFRCAERNAEDENRKEAFNDGYVKRRQSKV